MIANAAVNACAPANCPHPFGTSYPTAAEGILFAVWLAYGIVGAYCIERSNVGPSAPAEAHRDS